MKFYVLNQNNKYYEFTSWEKLIDWLYGYCTCQRWGELIVDLKFIGHNFNDTYVNLWPIFKGEKIYGRPVYHPVDFVIFDSIWRVVSTNLLFEGIKKKHNAKTVRKRRRRKYFEYRKEPVPNTRKYKKGSSICRSIRKNKSYAAKLEEYYHLFPNDSKMRDRKWLVKMWNDDLGMRTRDRSWKRQRKIKKQWQKNAPI